MQSPRSGRRESSLEDRALALIHQFGKDLCWIRSSARRIRGSSHADRIEAAADTIRQIAEDMSESVRQILNEAGGCRHSSRSRLSELVGEAAQRVERFQGRAEIQIAPMSATARDPLVDRHLLPVLVELLENAVRATAASGGIQITMADGDVPGVRITDSGVGMSQATMSDCMRPGFTSWKHVEGHGVGLGTCESIVTSLGGRLHFESELGRGTVVTVLLPEAPESGHESVSAASSRCEAALVGPAPQRSS